MQQIFFRRRFVSPATLPFRDLLFISSLRFTGYFGRGKERRIKPRTKSEDVS
ncbi:hypothetical protein Hdeb2414_s0353g00874601 [Helianthus debilis subsp. tardiflorus]